ncbi:MAG: carotenoid 1,2-hydratase [Nevskia sp.]
MTERGRERVQRDSSGLAIGPSTLHWDGNALAIEIDERTAPLPSRIRGTVRVHPCAITDYVGLLDESGQHCWRPIAPCSRVEVRLSSPALRWTGEGYLDSNFGAAPIEDAIAQWHWSRAKLREGTAVIYEVKPRAGAETALALRFDRRGQVEAFDPPPRTVLPGSAWRIARATRAEAGDAALVRTLEDTPFYARSVIAARLFAQKASAVHESLDLDRFRQPIVQAMLPFRMPRRRS